MVLNFISNYESCQIVAETVSVKHDHRGALGEALIKARDYVPIPLEDAIEEYVRETYEVGSPAGIRTSLDGAKYLQARTADGDEVSWRTDSFVTCSWISAEKSEDVERRKHGGYTETRPQDEQATFPVDVKTGVYAELSDRQKKVVNTVKEADTTVHPTVVSVSIEGLPEEFSMSVCIH